VHGRWTPADPAAIENAQWVYNAGPLERLQVYLLDPESEDGLATWDLFERTLAPGRYPVARAVDTETRR
jgi:hypothetical protein